LDLKNNNEDIKMELTKEQIEDLAAKIFNEESPGYGDLKDQNGFVRNDWIKAAYSAVEGYNTVAEYVDFPGLSIVKNCCMICKHVDLYRPACNLRGDDIDLECCCSKFELFEFEEEEDDKKAADAEFWERIINNLSLNSYDPYHY